eukprot:jgi/Chrzof1/9914/Cz04g20190.t1
MADDRNRKRRLPDSRSLRPGGDFRQSPVVREREKRQRREGGREGAKEHPPELPPDLQRRLTWPDDVPRAGVRDEGRQSHRYADSSRGKGHRNREQDRLDDRQHNNFGRGDRHAINDRQQQRSPAVDRYQPPPESPVGGNRYAPAGALGNDDRYQPSPERWRGDQQQQGEYPQHDDDDKGRSRRPHNTRGAEDEPVRRGDGHRGNSNLRAAAAADDNAGRDNSSRHKSRRAQDADRRSGDHEDSRSARPARQRIEFTLDKKPVDPVEPKHSSRHVPDADAVHEDSKHVDRAPAHLESHKYHDEDDGHDDDRDHEQQAHQGRSSSRQRQQRGQEAGDDGGGGRDIRHEVRDDVASRRRRQDRPDREPTQPQQQYHHQQQQQQQQQQHEASRSSQRQRTAHSTPERPRRSDGRPHQRSPERLTRVESNQLPQGSDGYQDGGRPREERRRGQAVAEDVAEMPQDRRPSSRDRDRAGGIAARGDVRHVDDSSRRVRPIREAGSSGGGGGGGNQDHRHIQHQQPAGGDHPGPNGLPPGFRSGVGPAAAGRYPPDTTTVVSRSPPSKRPPPHTPPKLAMPPPAPTATAAAGGGGGPGPGARAVRDRPSPKVVVPRPAPPPKVPETEAQKRRREHKMKLLKQQLEGMCVSRSLTTPEVFKKYLQAVRKAPDEVDGPKASSARLAAMSSTLRRGFTAVGLPGDDVVSAPIGEDGTDAHRSNLQWCIDHYSAQSSAPNCRVLPGGGTVLLPAELQGILG